MALATVAQDTARCDHIDEASVCLWVRGRHQVRAALRDDASRKRKRCRIALAVRGGGRPYIDCKRTGERDQSDNCSAGGYFVLTCLQSIFDHLDDVRINRTMSRCLGNAIERPFAGVIFLQRVDTTI